MYTCLLSILRCRRTRRENAARITRFSGVSRLSVLTIAIFIGLQSLTTRTVFGDDPEMLGVVGELVRPQIAQQLQISPSQQDRLQRLIDDRREAMLDIAGELRQLPPGNRPSRIKELVRSIEKSAAAVLDLQQRSQMERFRLSKAGLGSLVEPDVAETLSLSQGQSEQIQTILSSRNQLIKENGTEALADAEIDRRLRAQLTQSQWLTWQTLAGYAPKSSNADLDSAPNNSTPQIEGTSSEATQSPEVMKSEEDGKATVQSTQNSSGSLSDATANTTASSTNGSEPATSSTAKGSSSDMAAGANASNSKHAVEKELLALNFKATPWEQVLQWVANEAELSLQADVYPPGSFTYRDPFRKYSVGEALDVMNGVLLSKGYRLVRRQRSLMVIDLGSGENPEIVRGLIRELAELVQPEELDLRGEYELLKCLFVLSRLSPEEAQKEIQLLIGPEGSTVPLASAGQILVTETAGKLKLIREMLARVESPESARGSKIVSLTLNFVTAEEVLSVARPLLGLKDQSNQSDDLNLSTDALGNTIYATGSTDKLQKLRDIAQQIDVKPDSNGQSAINVETPSLRTHRVLSSDPEMALNVLQTMLAGSTNVRIALEPKTNSIVASASQAEHRLIDETLTELAGENSSFNIIPLERVDVQAALLTLEKFFGKSSSKDAEAGGKGPIFFGDIQSRSLMVKGTPSDVEQVRDLIGKLETNGPQSASLGGTIRVLPMSNKTADRALEQIQYLWDAKKKKNRIRIKVPQSTTSSSSESRRSRLGEPRSSEKNAARNTEKNADKNSDKNTDKSLGRRQPSQDRRDGAAKERMDSKGGKSEKESKETSPVDDSTAPEASDRTRRSGRNSTSRRLDAKVRGSHLPSHYVSYADDVDNEDASEPAEQSNSELRDEESAADIVILRSPTGLIITSDDPEVLDEFEQMVRVVTDQMNTSSSEPTVFYLKYIGAKSASELVKSIIIGEASSGGGGGGGLLGGVASNILGEVGGGLVGSLLSSGGGSSASSSSSISGGRANGEISIVADPRLNCLVVSANAIDLELIEEIIDLVDQEDSPTQIETKGKIRIIPVVNNNVEDVAKVVTQVFADRIASPANAGGGGQQRQPSAQEFFEALRGGGGGRNGRGGAQSELKEATMTISSDAKNNSLIVSSSLNLFEEVEALVAMLDEAALEKEERVEVVQLDGSVNATVVQSALRATFGNQAKSSTGTTPASTTSPQTGGGFDPAQAAQRAEFIRQFQGRGGQGGGGGGGGGGGFGGGNRGGGNFGGGNFGGGNFGGGNFGGGNRGGGNQGGGNNRGGGR